jgi:hypothetical protein
MATSHLHYRSGASCGSRPSQTSDWVYYLHTSSSRAVSRTRFVAFVAMNVAYDEYHMHTRRRNNRWGISLYDMLHVTLHGGLFSVRYRAAWHGMLYYMLPRLFDSQPMTLDQTLLRPVGKKVCMGRAPPPGGNSLTRSVFMLALNSQTRVGSPPLLRWLAFPAA